MLQRMMLTIPLIGFAPAAEEFASATLALSHHSAAPGATVAAAIHLRVESPWHWYWINSGDSGSAPQLTWILPPGVHAGPTAWPAPTVLRSPDGVTFSLHDGILLTELQIAATAAATTGPLRIAARIEWMACGDTCVPLEHQVEATFTIGATKMNPAGAAVIAQARQQQPTPGTDARLNRTRPGRWTLAVSGPAGRDSVLLPEVGGWYDGPVAIAGQDGTFVLESRQGFSIPPRLRAVLRSASAAWSIDLPWPTSP